MLILDKVKLLLSYRILVFLLTFSASLVISLIYKDFGILFYFYSGFDFILSLLILPRIFPAGRDICITHVIFTVAWAFITWNAAPFLYKFFRIA